MAIFYIPVVECQVDRVEQFLEAVSKPQIALKAQVERSEIPLPGAQADEKAQHTR
jgi:hypothetical protein